mmetsp:Transcript_59968/g.178479  ORF Transcript_59968/g.178479 Transcript_59968/m.178479 type:complete len:253 (+) Transcript_59968:2-760(+)
MPESVRRPPGALEEIARAPPTTAPRACGVGEPPPRMPVAAPKPPPPSRASLRRRSPPPGLCAGRAGTTLARRRAMLPSRGRVPLGRMPRRACRPCHPRRTGGQCRAQTGPSRSRPVPASVVFGRAQRRHSRHSSSSRSTWTGRWDPCGEAATSRTSARARSPRVILWCSQRRDSTAVGPDRGGSDVSPGAVLLAALDACSPGRPPEERWFQALSIAPSTSGSRAPLPSVDPARIAVSRTSPTCPGEARVMLG